MPMSKTNGIKPISSKTKVNPKFFISYTNITGQRLNFTVKTDLTFPGYRSTYFSVEIQSLATYLLNCQSHGLGAYIKGWLACVGSPNNKYPDFPLMYFRVAPVHSTPFIFPMYHPEDDRVVIK